MMRDMNIVDSHGNEFGSTREMCRYYKVRYPIYIERINAGWGLRLALTTVDAGWNRDIEDENKAVDYLGIEHKNTRAMCEYYNVSYSTFRQRKKAKKCIKTCLEVKPVIKDHLDNVFKTVQDMCKYHNVSYGT